MADKDTVEVVLRVSRPLIESTDSEGLAQILGVEAVHRVSELLEKENSDG